MFQKSSTAYTLQIQLQKQLFQKGQNLVLIFNHEIELFVYNVLSYHKVLHNIKHFLKNLNSERGKNTHSKEQ